MRLQKSRHNFEAILNDAKAAVENNNQLQALAILHDALSHNQNSSNRKNLIARAQLIAEIVDILISLNKEDASSLKISDNLEEAEKYCLKGLQLLATVDMPDETRARLLSAEGVIRWFRFGPGAAIGSFQKSCDEWICSKQASPEKMANAFQNVALCKHAIGKYDEAISGFKKAIRLMSDVSDKPDFGLYVQLANVLGDYGRSDAAVKLLDKVRPNDEAKEDTQIRWLNARALIAWQAGDYKTADRHYDKIHDIYADAVVPNVSRAAALTYAAIFKIQSGWLSQAKDILDLASHLNKKNAPFSFRMNHLKALLRFETVRKNDAAALNAFHEAKALIDKEMSGNSEQIIELCLLALNAGKTSPVHIEALDILENDLSLPTIKDPFLAAKGEFLNGILSWLCLTAIVPDHQKYEEIMGVTIQACLYRGATEYNWKFWFVLMQLLAQRGYVTEAIVAGKLAAHEILTIALPLGLNNPMGQALLQERYDCQSLLMHLLVSEGRFHEWQNLKDIFQEIEAANNLRILKPKSDESAISIFTDMELELIESYFQQKKDCSELRQKEQETTHPNELEKFLPYMNAVKLLFDQLWNGKFHNSSLSQLKAKQSVILKPQTTTPTVCYIQDQNKLIIQLHTSSTMQQMIVEKSSEQISILVHELIQKIKAQHSDWLQRSRQLYKILIEPIKFEIKKYESINIIAMGSIASLPFEVLYDGTHQLIDRFKINSQSLHKSNIATKTKPSYEILLCGNSKVNSDDNRLPHVENELQNIKRIIPSHQLLLEQDFNLKKFISKLGKKPRAVHFSGHFEYIAGAPQRSFITTGQNDRLPLAMLLADESQWSSVELIFMAGCNTAIEERHNNGAGISVAELFLKMGVKHYIGAGWPVNDEASALIVTSFYKYLSDGSGIPAALRQAQMDLRISSQFKAPLHWAAFRCFSLAN